ncbi:MAG: type 1 glutamine amidotransferase [Aquabacterium sp.]
MRPILILQHLHNDGPGYLGDWLQRQGLPVDVRNTEAGDAFPGDMDNHSGLAILGGAMSANDALPSLRQAEQLILEAMDRGVPVLGHCLGGQLMARAMGAAVGASPQPEIGWQPITVEATPAARAWFGDRTDTTVFHWHYEVFDLPAGAVRLAHSPACPNQAFGIGPHLAMQFHVEIDAHKARRWALEGEPDHLALVGNCDSVQSPEVIVAGVDRHLASHQALADQIYRHWARGLRR